MLTKYRGVILGLAYADALGAGYESQAPDTPDIATIPVSFPS